VVKTSNPFPFAVALAVAWAFLPPIAGAADPLAPQAVFDAHSFDGRVARTSDGRHVVAWEDGRSILVQRYAANATPIGAAIRIPDAEGTKPRVAMDAHGRFVVVWQSSDSSEVRARRFSADGIADGAELPVSGPRAHILDAAVDMQADGGFVVVWDQYASQDTGNGMSCVSGYGDCLYLHGNSIHAQRYSADGSALGKLHTIDGNTIASVSIGQAALGAGPGVSGPDVSLRSDGSYVVAWSRVAVGPPGTISGVFTRTITARDVPMPPNLVKYLDAGRPAFNLGLDSDAAGNYIVAYSQQVKRNPAYGVFQERFDPHDRRLGGTYRLDDDRHALATAPDVSVQASGGFLVLWQSGAAGSTAWSARRITADGTAVAGAFSALSATASGQVAQVSGNASGNLAVDWQSPWHHDGAPAHVVAGP
jgi:hypothetical protein